MNRFDEVARLITIVPPTGIIQIAYTKDLIDAAPWLLEAAACFHHGDAERIARIAREDLLEGCCGQCDADIDMMHRLQKAAEIMEGQE